VHVYSGGGPKNPSSVVGWADQYTRAGGIVKAIPSPLPGRTRGGSTGPIEHKDIWRLLYAKIRLSALKQAVDS
jgi:hypothetical protein